ncbi:MAG TPA: DUF1501 domain-containing protein [Mycobacteriales bacterium]|nr:DUF1501 domain-containing protein [Mycobacteriales bacterium]
MDTLTRRKFLIASGVTGAAALAAGAGTVGWREIAGRASADPLEPDANVLVLVTLYGGNDGLGTVVPYADGAYHDARPDLAYGADEVLELDDQLGLNPSMTGFKALWDDKKLAVVRGVGYPKPDHSHFRSMDIWQSGSPDHPANTGWIGRWLDATRPDPMRVVSVGATLPPLAIGTRAAGVALPLTSFQAPTGPLGAGVTALSAADPADPPTQAMAARATGTLLSATALFGPPLDAAGSADPDEDDNQAQGGSAGGQNALAKQLGIVSRCIKANVPTQVYAVSLGGFDTHADEKGTQSRLLGELDTAVSGFVKDMSGQSRGVVVAIYSEFGRRVGANASQGTDHGTAGPLLVAGTPVRGGFYGDQPSLTSLDDGDLKVTTDFRSVYGTLLEKVLDTEAGRVLEGSRPTLGFL